MKLIAATAVTEFLKDFAIVIQQTAAANGCSIKSFTDQGQQIFVDQRESLDVLFLTQFYNRVARMELTNEIDLEIILDDMLKEKGLSGINADELSNDLVIFFSKYGFINPVKRVTDQPAKLQANIEALNLALLNLGDDNCYKDPVNSLIKLAQCKDGSTVSDCSPTALITDASLDKMITDTRKFIAPKFGEKNCFSYEARQREYKKEAALTGLASAANGVIGALAQVAALAVLAGYLAGLIALCLLVPPAIPAIIALSIGSLIAAPIPSFVAAGITCAGVSLIGKANNQRKMCGTMFSIANAADNTKHNDVEISALAARVTA